MKNRASKETQGATQEKFQITPLGGRARTCNREKKILEEDSGRSEAG